MCQRVYHFSRILPIGIPLNIIYGITSGAMAHAETPSWFIPVIRKIIHSPLPSLSKSQIKFEWSPSAMRFNSDLLESVNFDLGKLISQNPSSEIGYGSEFRPVATLEPLLRLRPNWNRIKSFLSSGFTANFRQIDEAQCQNDNTKALRSGNHKSTLKQIQMLTKIVRKEVHLGYQFVFHPSLIKTFQTQ